MSTAQVREATTDDAQALAAFLLAAWREAGPDSPGFAGATPEIMAEIATSEAIRARIGPGGRRMFLAEEPTGVIGFAATRPLDAANVELAGIVVARAATGRGVGSNLVRAARAAAASEGFDRMLVRTERTNSTAIAFYRAQGFEQVGQTEEQVGTITVPVVELASPLS